MECCTLWIKDTDDEDKDRDRIKALEMWIWRQMEGVKWIDKVK